MYFVAGKRAFNEHIGEAILMRVFLARKVNAVQVAYSAVSPVAADEPRRLDHFLSAVASADGSNDRVGQLGNRHELGLTLYFDIVGAEQTLQSRLRFALLEVYCVRIWAVDFAATGVHEAFAVGVLAHAQYLV